MSIQSATPVSGSIVQRGETITVVWDATTSGGPPTVAYEPGGGQPLELIYIGGATAFQAGYTGSQVFDGGLNTWTLSFKRNAGWGTSAFGIAAYYSVNRFDLSYAIVAEGQYPPEMQPFNDPAEGEGTAGILSIQDDGVGQGDATTLNFADNLTATVADSIATINGEAGGGGLPGTEGIFGTITTDGVGGYTLSANSQGISDVTLTGTGILLSFVEAFADSDYPVQGTANLPDPGNPTRIVINSLKTTTYTSFFTYDETGTQINPLTAELSIDFLVGGLALGEGGVGGSDITVVDESTTLTTGVTKFTYKGDGVTVTEDATPDELTVTIPGLIAGAQDGGIFGTLTTDGDGGWDLTANSQGVTGLTLGPTSVLLSFEVQFADSDYAVQCTANVSDVNDPNRFVVNAYKAPTYTALSMYNEAGEPLNPLITELSIDFLVGGLGIGEGDVSSSVSSVGNREFAIFDGTSGKIIRNTPTGVYQSGGSIHCTDAFIGVRLGVATAALGGHSPYLEVAEHTTGTPSGGTSYGRFWVKPANTFPVTAQNRPYYIANDGNNFDLSEGGTGIGIHALGGSDHTADTLANFNTKISDAAVRVTGTHVTATDPVATAIDGDIWIEIT